MVTDPTKVTPFVVILSDKVYYWQYGIKRDAIAADCFITKKYHKIVWVYQIYLYLCHVNQLFACI